MEIWYLGFSSFRIRTKKGIIIFNPYGPKSGQDFPNLKADVVLNSQKDSPFTHGPVKGNPFVIEAPGEYEISDINIFGNHSYKKDKENKFTHSDNTNYLVDCENIKICHLGQLEHPLEQKSINTLNTPDLLFVPLGQPGGLEPKEAVRLMRQLETNITIPVHHQKESFDKFIGDIEVVQDFLKETGTEGEKEPKLIVHPSDFNAEDEKIVLVEKH